MHRLDAPPQLPSMDEARQIKTKGSIPEGSWPCVRCDARGCTVCKGSGIASRAAFVRWYTSLVAKRAEWREAWVESASEVAQPVTCEDFYSVERLRKLG